MDAQELQRVSAGLAGPLDLRSSIIQLTPAILTTYAPWTDTSTPKRARSRTTVRSFHWTSSRSTPRKDFAADLPAPGCAPGRQSGDARLGRLPRAPHFPAPVSARDHTPRPPCISGLRRAKSRRGSTPAPEDPALLGPNGPALPGPALLQPLTFQ